MNARLLRVVLAQPRGFCAGVERAIEIVERALERFGPPVYVRHEIVHNKHVVETLKSKGARFVDEVDEIPEGAVAVFSAHGVAEAVELAANERGLRVIDAACPLVTKVHKEGQRYAANGFDVVLIGHAGHPEVEGTMGRIKGRVHLIGSVEDVARIDPGDPSKLAFVTQTTLSVDDTRDIIAALRARFPNIVGPDTRDICYATQNRQTAVRALARVVDLILVVGAQNSSNSNRLREIGEAAGTPSYLIESADKLDPAWLDGVRTIGITAGASAPELLVQDLIRKLGERYVVSVEVLAGIEENVHFRLPPELADRAAPAAIDRPSLQ
ncbi:MAG TPA: 4-hydroxy-3-methylbut-2-enyl diphosphate reductase [Thermomicrobiales bacterium]|nr:4-hydroxy-3-methylbut-2-enyl diphosphate reductase [Thermomicrobiales bacterium]